MRASLLLLLGGILVWFVWHSFGNGTAIAQASTPPPASTSSSAADAVTARAVGAESAAMKTEPIAPKSVAQASKPKVFAKDADSDGAKPVAKSAQAALAA